MAEVLDWFTLTLRHEYGVVDLPPPCFPFSWPKLKATMEVTFASAFSVNYIWQDQTNLQRGQDIITFHFRFTNLATLVGESPDTALYSSRLWDTYDDKMTIQEQHTVISVIHMAQQLGWKPCLRDAMAVLDKDNLKYGGSQLATKPTPMATTLTTSSTRPVAGLLTTQAPGPMEPSAFAGNKSDPRQSARCRDYGHWSSVCPTPRNWKRGDPIAGRPIGNSSTGNGKQLAGNDKPWTRARGQVYNTKVDSGDEVDRNEGNTRESEEEEEDLEEEAGKA